MLKVEKLEKRINDVWINVCHKNKIPKEVKIMYTSKCSKFASIHAAIKTHKSSSESLIIRPIINSIDSPGYNLSRFLQKLIQPLVSDNLVPSEIIMNRIKSIDQSILRERPFPISLDVENMFHSIPRNMALELLHGKLLESQNNTSMIQARDIVNLVQICLSCNHFIFDNKLYFQREGLPMGNRLSSVLAELFMAKFIYEINSRIEHPPPTFRYVDDLLLFTKGPEESNTFLTLYNNNPHGIKFTLELPVADSLPFLDFKVKILNEGIPEFEFYRKLIRKDNFINRHTALPKHTVNNIIKNEWTRIRKRCSDENKFRQHEGEFLKRLRRNGHNLDAQRFFNRNPFNPDSFTNHLNENSNLTSQKRFFLNIPFIDDSVEHLIKKSIQELGVKISISHKGTKLKHLTSNKARVSTCNKPNCKMNSPLCMVKGVIYLIKCSLCEASYIGSTWRHLHTRYAEHVSLRSSPIYVHNTRCNGPLAVSVISRDANTQRMRIKEALAITKWNPTLNTKDNLFSSHILFE